MKKAVLASTNEAKLEELRTILRDAGIRLELLPVGRFTDIVPQETGYSFIENAILKARYACRVSRLPALADDSGLVVDALQGAPGILSARYAGPRATDQDNIDLLLRNLAGVESPARSARFVCCVAWMSHGKDPMPLLGQGFWEGAIAETCVGAEGFGYDPVFYAPASGCTAAQMTATDKHRVSHRGQALRQLAGQLGELDVGWR